MGKEEQRVDGTTAWRGRRARQRLECRECEVICERVVYPWHCLRSGCEYVYSYPDQDTMYFGCLHKVFAPELDLAAFCESGGTQAAPDPDPAALGLKDRQRRKRRGRTKAMDPYGPLRVARLPRPQCLTRVEQAYDSSETTCCNPTFFHHPWAQAEDAMRLTVKDPDEVTRENSADDHPLT